MEQDGYEVPIHTSLTARLLMKGVPRQIAILNGTLAAAMGLGLQSFYILPINIAIHIAAVYATKRDPMFFECFVRHMRQKKYYST